MSYVFGRRTACAGGLRRTLQDLPYSGTWRTAPRAALVAIDA